MSPIALLTTMLYQVNRGNWASGHSDADLPRRTLFIYLNFPCYKQNDKTRDVARDKFNITA